MLHDDSIQNYNNHISIPPKNVTPLFYKRRDLVTEPRKTFGEYKKLFRAKKEVFSKELCATQKCLKEIVKIVSLADNPFLKNYDDLVKTSNATIEFDYNNPQKLDVQGIDQMQTYRNDEQDIQAKREYEIMKRELDKRRFTVMERDRYEQEVRDKKFKLPDLFNIDFDPIYGEISEKHKKTEEILQKNDEEEYQPDVLLIRTKDKPINRAIIEAESDRRTKNLQNRLTQLWQKQKLAEEERAEIEKKIQNELSATLANDDFHKLYEEKKPEEIFVLPPEPKPPRKYPNTFKELASFRRKLNQERREARDKCIEREKFLHELGKETFCQEKFLKVDDFSDSEVNSMSTQSSDGEDGLEMGYKNSREFLVRGRHDKFSNEPRGKLLNHTGNRSVKTCLNRDEWIQSTFNECERKKTLKKVHYVTDDVTDENYDIFHRKWKYEKPKNVKSPVKEYIEGKNILEAFTKTKNLNVKMPNYVKVKNFNLTNFLFGSQKGKKMLDGDHKLYRELQTEGNNLMEKLKTLEKEDEEQQKVIKEQRMRYLGFKPQPKIHDMEKVFETDSDNDWLPNEEIFIPNLPLPSTVDLKSEQIALAVSNMRAPEYREPTLRRHPRRLRQKSVSKIHENDSRAPLNVARLQKLNFDAIKQSNLAETKNEHFKYRRHHDHLDHTQQKMVRVKYIPKMQKFEETINAVVMTENQQENEPKRNETIKFPIKNENFDQDLSRFVPEKISVENLNEKISNHQSEKLIKNEKIPSEASKDAEKSRFTTFIQSTFKKYITEATGTAIQTSYEYPEAKNYRNELLREKISADSCLSSVTSSLCTNFTNDSGSFFIINDKKVPLDYLMKHQVPFEALTQNHRQAKPIEREDEYHAPYLTVIHAGQQIEMRDMCVPKDKFYTQVTRDRAGIRNRLKVSTLKLENQFVGHGKNKFPPRFG